MSAHNGSSRRAHVIAAKAGLVGLTRALAHDLGADSVTVNSVVPGLIQTARGSSSGSTPAHHAIHQTLVEHNDYLKRLLPSLVISAATTLIL